MSFRVLPARPGPAARLPPAYAGYEVVDFNGSAFLYSREVNRRLYAASLSAGIRFVVQPEPFMCPLLDAGTRDALVEHLRGTRGRDRQLFNEPKVRLASDLTATGILNREPTVIQDTDYFWGLCTNELTGADVWEEPDEPVGGPPRLVLPGTRLLTTEDGLLHELSASPCSNHIGSSTLVVSRDRALVVLRQSAASAQSAGLLAPTGSGSADQEDREAAEYDLTALARHAMERELAEEVGLVARPSGPGGAPLLVTVVIGYARLLARGGKPDFFGITRMSLSSREIIAAAAEGPERNAASVVCRLERPAEVGISVAAFLDGHAASVSLPLYINLMFLTQFAADFPADLERFIDAR